MTTDEAPSGPATPGGTPHRARNVVLIVAAFLVVLGAATGGVLAFLAYDNATSIDRSNPQVVTDQFLEATLVDRNPDRLSLLLCSSWSVAAALASASAPSAGSVTANWGDFVTSVDGDEATVIVNVQFAATVGQVIQRLSQRWTLDLVLDDGWRVCGLTKGASLGP